MVAALGYSIFDEDDPTMALESALSLGLLQPDLERLLMLADATFKRLS
jgi:hypothetical protein